MADHVYARQHRSEGSVEIGPCRGERGKSDAATERMVTQRQAAELVGCSKDTIIRARLAGRFPEPILTATPGWFRSATSSPPACTTRPPRRRVRRDQPDGQNHVQPVSMELARAEARITALEDLVARQDDELRFLRQLTTDTLGRRAS